MRTLNREEPTGESRSIEHRRILRKPLMVIEIEVVQHWTRRTRSPHPAKLYNYENYKKTIWRDVTFEELEEMEREKVGL